MSQSIVELREASKLKPNDPRYHLELGTALLKNGDLGSAQEALRTAIRLKPDYSIAILNLGIALANKGDQNGAVAAFREAIKRDAKNASAHHALGRARLNEGDLNDAIDHLRQASQLMPDNAGMHSDLGNALLAAGDLNGAIDQFRDAVRKKPDDAAAHAQLGNVLRMSGNLEDALKELKESVRINPGEPAFHCQLGLALRSQALFSEAKKEYQRGHQLGMTNPRWAQPSGRWVSECESLVELAPKLPAFLKGDLQPASALEQTRLGLLCLFKHVDAASARFFKQAFTADPGLAKDIDSQDRYNAACAAVLAGTGQSLEQPPLDDAVQSQWRSQALNWLKADLGALSERLESNPRAMRSFVLSTLRHWRVDSDLLWVRDSKALAKLSVAERSAWSDLWKQVDQLLSRATAVN